MRISRVLLIVAMLGCMVGTASANSVLGVPVTGSGSTTHAVPNCPTLEGQSCYNPTTGQVGFFIPLSAGNGGTFGVTNHPGGTAGTYSDSGTGATSSLLMWLMFSPVSLPVSSASLTFNFVDLDLIHVNDPTGFFETIRFYSSNGTPLTPLITATGQTGGGSLAYTVTGNSNTQTIYFPNVMSILQNPFYVELQFGSQYTQLGTNTIEFLDAELDYTNPGPPPQVPEPASLVLMGTGLLAIGGILRKKLALNS